MMGIAASLLTLVSAALFYLTDREQRWLAAPLASWQRLVSILLLLLAAGLWVVLLGIGVGLMAALWLFILALVVQTLLAAHQRDTYQKNGGRP
ncbi:hypothetical protein MWU49_13360 [Alcanivorax sp. S6407]|uniref:hypothetical protein n=1 Tax=Alcanivorax sp. S6407 TaxID=2926424 RepID=UPI001FF20874|nr:hypothetical protein [Alcanivorax sp. S6407]MCK0154702.1 hypothetical protein [Alcanivorax sp. S6407]